MKEMQNYLGKKITLTGKQIGIALIGRQGRKDNKKELTFILEGLCFKDDTLVALIGSDTENHYHLPLQEYHEWSGFIIEKVSADGKIIAQPKTQIRQLPIYNNERRNAYIDILEAQGYTIISFQEQ